MNNDETSDKILNSPISTSMRKNPPTVQPTEPISSISYTMVKEDIEAVIVVEEDRPVGIITEKDILERVLTPGKDAYKTLAKEVMSKPLISIESSHPIKEALRLMKENKIRRLAVTEKGSLVGLITERRLLESICNYII
jgi:CBS domain-containing protein